MQRGRWAVYWWAILAGWVLTCRKLDRKSSMWRSQLARSSRPLSFFPSWILVWGLGLLMGLILWWRELEDNMNITQLKERWSAREQVGLQFYFYIYYSHTLPPVYMPARNGKQRFHDRSFWKLGTEVNLERLVDLVWINWPKQNNGALNIAIESSVIRPAFAVLTKFQEAIWDKPMRLFTKTYKQSRACL